MARKGLTGQLHMFDFFRELETAGPPSGEVEMVSLMPEDEPKMEEETVVEKRTLIEMEQVVKEQPESTEDSESDSEPQIAEPIETSETTEMNVHRTFTSACLETESLKTGLERPVMQRIYTTRQGEVEIAYINYSKVRMCEPGKEPQVIEFASSKEAVDYYVEQMQKLEELYGEA